MKKASTDIVTPFDWRRYQPSAEPAGKPQVRRAKKLTVQERVARIMAHRWGNPYCKPGPAY